MSESVTSLCNMALARIGNERIDNYDEDSVTAIHCRTHYEETRDSLLQSHWWRFATARASLSEDTETPDFEFDHQYILPTDCLRVMGVYDTTATYAVEGERLLTSDDSVDIYYVRKVTDPAQFSPLFIKTLVLHLAMDLVMPMSQNVVLRREVQDELREVLSRARRVNLDEINTTGRADYDTWLDAREVGID